MIPCMVLMTPTTIYIRLHLKQVIDLTFLRLHLRSFKDEINRLLVPQSGQNPQNEGLYILYVNPLSPILLDNIFYLLQPLCFTERTLKSMGTPHISEVVQHVCKHNTQHHHVDSQGSKKLITFGGSKPELTKFIL